MPKYRIDKLTSETIDWFIDVAAVRMLTEEVNRSELVDMDVIEDLAIKGLIEETAFVVFDGDTPIGATGALVLPNMFNRNIFHLMEFFWYVLPEYRNTRAGTLLFNALVSKAESKQLDLVLCLMNTSDVKDKTIIKKGFLKEETFFRKKYK